MSKDAVKILEMIIAMDGVCKKFASSDDCNRCPLGNKIINGRRVSCVEYLNAWRHPKEEFYSRYRQAAQDELFDILFENALK